VRSSPGLDLGPEAAPSSTLSRRSSLSTEFYPFLLAALGGMAAAVAGTLALIRFRGLVRREGKDSAIISLPWRGKLEVRFDPQPDGLHIPEALEVLEKIRRLSALADFDWLLNYAQKYRINFLGLRGKSSEHWHPGFLACSTLDWTPQGGYRIYFNGELDLEETAARLSQELGLELKPEEVQPFLFLHEIGHTPKAGNVCLISAAISSALSGGRRTHRRRRELQKLKGQVEKHADAFAVQELLKWRACRREPTLAPAAEKIPWGQV